MKMSRYIKILSLAFLLAFITSCTKDADYAIDQTGYEPCLKWQVGYLDGYKNLSANIGSDGLTIDAVLLGKNNLGSEVQYLIQPLDEEGKLAQLKGDFFVQLDYENFTSSPGGGTFEMVIGGHTGTNLTYNGIYSGSIGSSSSDSTEGLGIYNNTNGYTPINTYTNSDKFLPLPGKLTSGSISIQRAGEELIIVVKTDYNELRDTQPVKDDMLDFYFQLGTSADENVSSSIIFKKFTVVGGGEAIRSDFFDCYSIRLNK